MRSPRSPWHPCKQEVCFSYSQNPTPTPLVKLLGTPSALTPAVAQQHPPLQYPPPSISPRFYQESVHNSVPSAVGQCAPASQVGVLLASSEWVAEARVAGKHPVCAGQHLQQRLIQTQASAVLRLGDPDYRHPVPSNSNKASNLSRDQNHVWWYSGQVPRQD